MHGTQGVKRWPRSCSILSKSPGKALKPTLARKYCFHSNQIKVMCIQWRERPKCLSFTICQELSAWVRWGQPVLDLFLLGQCMCQFWPLESRLFPKGQLDHMIPYLSLWKREEIAGKATWRLTFSKKRVLDLTAPMLSPHVTFKINRNRSSQLVLKGTWYKKTLKVCRPHITVAEES